MRETVSPEPGPPAAGAPARTLAAGLLLVTAALFVIGVTAEGDDHDEPGEAAESVGAHGENAASEAAEPRSDDHDESAERAEGTGGDSGSSEAGEAGEEGEGEILGVDVESPIVVAGAVAVSLALAGALWLRGRRGIAVAVVAFGLVFAVFDAVEAEHQLDKSRTGLAVLAVAIAAGHLGAAAAAAAAAVTARKAVP